jgi:hypothetical protein
MRKTDVSAINYQEVNPVNFLEEQDALREGQLAVEEYNQTINTHAYDFSKKRLVNRNIVIRLFKEDYASPIKFDGIESNGVSLIRNTPKVKVDPGFSPNAATAKHVEIENPVPYLTRGVIVAFDEKILEDHPWLKAGVIVDLMPFAVQDYMYYPDKTKIDFPVTHEDLLQGKAIYPNYEGYIKVPYSMIESYE